VPKLYLVRHAEPGALWGSHPDPGLSPLGHSQANAAAKHLATLGIGSLMTSPLARCRQTAMPLEATLGVQAIVNRAVAEIPVPAGITDHRTWLMAVMNGKWSDALVGEGLVAWRQGVATALLNLADDTIVFSHFVAINAAVSAAMGSDQVTVFKPGHASMTVLEASHGVLSVVELGKESAIHLA
jgi:broad specificity phosphatase PhoE